MTAVMGDVYLSVHARVIVISYCFSFCKGTEDVGKRYGFKILIRERFARVKVFVDILTKIGRESCRERVSQPV